MIAKNEHDKYIFTRFVNAHGSMCATKLNWREMVDNDSQAIVVHIPSNSIILDKTTYGLSAREINKLKRLKEDSIDICGLYTDACVYGISLQLWYIGIFPNILINYTATKPTRAKQVREMFEHQFESVDERE